MAGEVIRSVPVLSPHGGRVGTATVLEGHIEIVWDDKEFGKEVVFKFLIDHASSLVVYATGDPAVPAQ